MFSYVAGRGSNPSVSQIGSLVEVKPINGDGGLGMAGMRKLEIQDELLVACRPLPSASKK